MISSFMCLFYNSDMKTTFAQRLIEKRVKEKVKYVFQDNWDDYEESYGSDYNDCHGDYYDAEAEN